MKTLYLIRHAKSRWKYQELEDMDRPLKGRGIRDALTVAEYLAAEKVKPDIIFSSPATRALHTALIFARRLGYPFSEIQIRDKIYLSTVAEITEVVTGIDDRHKIAMVFGHNPTITNYVNAVSKSGVSHVPTSGMVCLQFDVPRWREARNNAQLLGYEFPNLRM